MRIRLAPLALFAVAAAGACGDGLFDADGRPEIRTLCGEGGTVRSPDGRLVLEVPPGALESCVVVTVAAEVVQGAAAYRIAPEETRLAVAARLELSAVQDPAYLVPPVVSRLRDGSWEALEPPGEVRELGVFAAIPSCGAGSECASGRCVAGGCAAVECTGDPDCTHGRRCLDGACKCEPGCQASSDCAVDERCGQLGACLVCQRCPEGSVLCGESCVAEDELNCGACGIGCQAWESCVAGACEPDSCGVSCPGGSFCNLGLEICVPCELLELCGDGLDNDCNLAVDDGCTCASDADCARGELCLGGACVPGGCRLDQDCPAGHFCDGGSCAPGCRTDQDCGAGESCQAGVCSGGCPADTLSCGGACVEEDARNCGGCGNACAVGQVCLQSSCTANMLCDGDTDGFASADPACGGTDCNDLDAAVNPGAVELCNQVDDDCDGVADDGCQQVPCRSDLECAAGQRCLNGLCR